MVAFERVPEKLSWLPVKRAAFVKLSFAGGICAGTVSTPSAAVRMTEINGPFIRIPMISRTYARATLGTRRAGAVQGQFSSCQRVIDGEDAAVIGACVRPGSLLRVAACWFAAVLPASGEGARAVRAGVP